MSDNIKDIPHSITIKSNETLFKGFRQLSAITYHEENKSQHHTREMMTGQKAVAVIVYDPLRDKLVLLHQFRLGAHLGTGCGFATEIVAGMVDEGESNEVCALRELEEETGLKALHIEPLCQFLTTPGMTDETIHLFYAEVDASAMKTVAGHALENEEIFPFLASFDEVMAAIDNNSIHNGITILALLWFARHRSRFLRKKS